MNTFPYVVMSFKNEVGDDYRVVRVSKKDYEMEYKSRDAMGMVMWKPSLFTNGNNVIYFKWIFAGFEQVLEEMKAND